MANEISKTPTQAKPQVIPLSKIHDLPNVFIAKPQDKSLGSMVLSIESSGIKEPVILRQRDDGEYQLLSGYRRRRASELSSPVIKCKKTPRKKCRFVADEKGKR